MLDIGDSFTIIKNVPCHKRTQCGEVSFIGATASRLDAIVEKLKDALAEVAAEDLAAQIVL